MKILITGGTGVIGRPLIDVLLRDGHEISVLTRNPDKAKIGLPSDVSIIKWDGTSTLGWAHIIEETNAVVNLAGESIAGESIPDILIRRWTSEQKKRIKQSREDTGHALVLAIQNATKKPEVFIQASAVGYYGPHGDLPVPESNPAGEDYLPKVCQAWEASTEKIEQLGIRRAIIRSGLVLASDEGILPIMLLPFRLFAGGPIGNGEQYIPWIHIKDQVDAVRFLLTNDNAHGTFNLTAPNPVSNKEFGRIAGKVLQRPYWFPTPSFAFKITLGEKATLVLDGQRAIPKRLLEIGFEFRFDSLEAALQDLNTLNKK